MHPAFVDLGEPSGLGWLDGFDELLVRCGLESNGAPDFDEKTGRLKYPLHGRIANRPAHDVELTIDTDKQEITLRGIVEETRFHFLKLRMTSTITTKFGSTRFHDPRRDRKLLGQPDDDADAVSRQLRPAAAGRRLAGRRPGQNARPAQRRGRPAASKPGTATPPPSRASRRWSISSSCTPTTTARRARCSRTPTPRAASAWSSTSKQLPWFTLWKNTTGEPDGYVTGLEPGTNFPNPRSFETAKNRVVKLAGGQKQSFDVTLEIHGSAAEVAAAEAAVAKIQAGRQSQDSDQPQADWCA